MAERTVAAARLRNVLAQLQASDDEASLLRAFEDGLRRMMSAPTRTRRLLVNRLEATPCALAEADPGAPSDRFVSASRMLQSDKKMGYTNYKAASRSRTSSYAHGPRGERSLVDGLMDPRALLGAAAVGLALSLLSSSSPVQRSIISRAWPHLLQLAIALFAYARRNQDAHLEKPRSNTALYILTGLVQLFLALRDAQGHSVTSFLAHATLGPIAPLVTLMKWIIVRIPSFLFKTVLLQGMHLLGRATMFMSIAVAIIVALGGLIVLAAENI
mmetsp:Transcript_8815/g.36575  ORF Transcript_8815/g.36575 Transcript_8815/m.36575 type:complete len:272 (+) Transcript_8815:90-905(+)|eukprot:CAMPEP_0114635798 /NCGR_PEP_ID=MMETSP0168-20121206/16663_1 /TAXON_ID=95228 ORGANISM="Vannella sp., Strain DIVA3 517/6/12" /NCGR_SAMPLE_ID=MMETSP0168 /ASSEMBLY_ACC=CAM_ASM_000044 /LENGTH=271 /DNA_ID=CAMNT_0001847505 /DNA_START=22 /DNA_END=837 /DNA_ORIENTATION=+